MFYSVAVQQLFLKQNQKKKKKNQDVRSAGEWQYRPFPPLLTPLASAEPAKRGLLGRLAV